MCSVYKWPHSDAIADEAAAIQRNSYSHRSLALRESTCHRPNAAAESDGATAAPVLD